MKRLLYLLFSLPSISFSQDLQIKSVDWNLLSFDYQVNFLGDIYSLNNVYSNTLDYATWNARRLSGEITAEYNDKTQVNIDIAYDFDENELWLRNAYIKHSFSNGLNIHLGKIKPRFGLLQSSSIKNILTSERTLSNDLLNIERSTGLFIEKEFDRHFLYTGYFQQKHNGNYLDSYIGRYVYQSTDQNSAYIGFSVLEQNYNQETFRFSSNATAYILDNFLKTEKVTADKVRNLGIDGAWTQGRFTLTGEVITAQVSSTLESDKNSISAYIQGSLFLTNNQHTFSKGRFKKLKHSSQPALELVSTLSFLDTTSSNNGFEAATIGVGLNYYYNSHFKVMLEASYLDITEGIYQDESGSIFKCRFELRF